MKCCCSKLPTCWHEVGWLLSRFSGELKAYVKCFLLVCCFSFTSSCFIAGCFSFYFYARDDEHITLEIKLKSSMVIKMCGKRKESGCVWVHVQGVSDIFMIPFPRHPYICSLERARALNLSLYAGKPAGGGWSPRAPCGQVHWEFMTPHSLQRSLKLAFATGETTPRKWHVMGQENKRNERETRWHSWKPMTGAGRTGFAVYHGKQ